MKKNEYSHRRIMKDFPVEDLAKGMELVLAEGKKPKKTTKGDMVVLTEDFCVGKSRCFVKASVALDENHGELVETCCYCDEFLREKYTCRHIEAILAAYMLQNEGEEALMDTEIVKKLRENTQLSDPFCPGILRRTDEELLPFLRAARGRSGELEQPKWLIMAETRNAEPISIEVFLRIDRNTLCAELKGGPKRHYVIRDLGNLSRAYLENRMYAFSGSVKCQAGRNQYLESDRPIMDFISDLWSNYERGLSGYSIYSRYSTDTAREICLTGRDLDAFMETVDGHRVTLNYGNNNQKKCVVNLIQEPEQLTLTKMEFGANLEGTEEETIACGMEWMYLRQGETILRLPAKQWEHRKALAEALGNRETIYIQEKDLPAVCEGLRLVGVTENHLQIQGMQVEDYMKEIPQIQIYLDHPQEDMITCEVKAHYPVTGKTYNVLDQQTESEKRNLAVEQSVGEEIWGYFTAYDEAAKQMCLQCDTNGLYCFMTETLKALEAYGEIFVSDKIKKMKVRSVGELSVGIRVDAGSLVMSLKSNLMNKDEMIQALSAYRSKKRFTRLKSGEFLVFPEQDTGNWEILSEAYRNYGKKDPEAMKLPLFRALYLQEGLQEREYMRLNAQETYTSLVRELKDEETWQYEVPESLSDILREYQKEGYKWMRMLKKNGFGGILADDMGLGKTLQVLAFLLSEKEEGDGEGKAPTLIIAPASLIYNWKKEIRNYTPELSCQVISGSISQRKMMIRQMKEEPVNVYITSYDLLKRDIKEYEGIFFANQIIDEAQYIKNPGTQVAKSVRLIESGFRMALTGTPIENRLSELWSIFDYLMPGFLFSYTRFRTEFETPVVNDRDEAVMTRLRSMVHPFILRRLKKDVLKDLPEKLEETVTVLLTGEQRKLYDAYAERLRLYLDKQSEEEFRQKKLEILKEITRLRQICCGPDLFLEDYKGENAKKDTCMELLHQAIDGGHKILLFSQFTSVLDEMGKCLGEEKIEYHRIDGSVSKENRSRQVDSFAVDQVPVFLISLKAGGTGLNLTAADIVIHYDPWWNLAAQNQATDRTHRIGQENTVTVYQLIAENTIEEQIALLQKTKAQLAEDILEGEGISSIMIDKKELLNLL